MFDDYLIHSTGAVVSDVCSGLKYAAWARQEARDIDLSAEYGLAWNLSHIMKAFAKRFFWGAASSSNVFWECTDRPLREILVPKPGAGRGEFITLLNPDLRCYGGKAAYYLEGCGSVGDSDIFIERKPSLDLAAFVLEEESQQTLHFEGQDARYAKHEYDHTLGRLITDGGIFFGFSDRVTTPDTEWFNNLIYDWADQASKGRWPKDGYLYLALQNDARSMYWQAYPKKEDIPKDSAYGKTIMMRLPDTRNIRAFLEYLPLSVISKSSFLKIPVLGIDGL